MNVPRRRAARATWGLSRRLWALASYLAIGATAAVLRCRDLGSFITVDEIDYWIGRSETFLRALGTGDYAATAITGHPGVTTMWLGSAGIVLREALQASGLLRDGSFQTVLALFQLPVALAHVVGILLGYALLRRLFPTPIALLAAFLWAADPFLVGYSRVLHVDALAATFGTLSLLCACVYWHHTPRLWALIGSGVCAGLAALSKSPALVLIPVVGLIGLAAAWRQGTMDDGQWTIDERSSRAIVYRLSSIVVLPLLAWGAILALTVFALWPVMWVDPLRAYATLRQGAELGNLPHEQGNFFLGQPDAAPNALFYPAALALRLTPWGLLGLLALARRRALEQIALRRDLAALACFAVLFIGLMSLPPKKFNRYLIPIVPAVDILSAAGLVSLARIRAAPAADDQQDADGGAQLSALGRAAIGAVAIGAVATAAWWHPYGIAYYNPLLGGAQAGANTFLTGWGEGLEQVAAWLNQQPDITGVVTVSTASVTLRPYMRRGAQVVTVDDRLPEHAGYVVVYIRHTQDVALWPPFDQFYGVATPLQTIRVHGVPYAWIYQVPPAVKEPRPADFGATIHLSGFDLEGALRPGGRATYKLVWDARQVTAADYVFFAHLLGPDGRRYAQADIPYPTSQWQPGRFVTTELPLSLPADAPRGDYQLFVGLYDQASGQRIPVAGPAQQGSARDGPNTLLLHEARVK